MKNRLIKNKYLNFLIDVLDVIWFLTVGVIISAIICAGIIAVIWYVLHQI